MKVVTIVGAKPQFIKTAAFSRAAKGKVENVILMEMAIRQKRL